MNVSFDPIGMLLTLLDHHVRFVLIGGYAAALRGSPMLTGIRLPIARLSATGRATTRACEGPS